MSVTAPVSARHTASDDRIFVGASMHDRVLANEPMLYFLSGRRSATRYHDFHPGVVTTAAVQEEMAADLERYRVNYLVLSSRYDRVQEPNESSNSSGVHFLDMYIAMHYLRVAEFGPYTVWQREQ